MKVVCERCEKIKDTFFTGDWLKITTKYDTIILCEDCSEKYRAFLRSEESYKNVEELVFVKNFLEGQEMREILFRGKRIDNGEWVYGYLLKLMDGYCIIPNICALKDFAELAQYLVDPSTVGQYIGEQDKNRLDIYEGDVVFASWYSYTEPIEDAFGEVAYRQDRCAFCICDDEHRCATEIFQGDAYVFKIEIIGNIHDNPELTPTNRKEPV